MKRAYSGILLILIMVLCMAACNSVSEELSDLPTLAPVKSVKPEESAAMTEAPEPTVSSEPTKAPELTVPPELTEVPEPTGGLIPTMQQKPTEASRPTEVPKNTVPPSPTAVPKPTATSKPTAAAKPTEAPLSPDIKKLLDNAERYENTIIRGTVCKSEQETNAFVREMSLTYSSFAVIVEHAGFLNTAKEYMTLYPEIEKMTIQKIEIYQNGICAVFSDVETVYDANLCYRIRTGDSSVLSADEKKIAAYLNSVLEQTGAAEMSSVEAVKALHDYLVLQLKYDETYQDISHSPEGVMKNRTAVCDGYARTMRLLLLLAGIDSRIISGTAGGEPHAWNLVKMEDGWYHVDVTWDDPIPDVEGKVGYLYFLKNDAYMAQTHTWSSEISCTSDAYSVYVYQEVLCDSYDALQRVYEQQVETEQYLVFCYPKGGNLTQEMIREYIMNRLQSGLTYFPEKETGDYLVLEIMNPLMQN